MSKVTKPIYLERERKHKVKIDEKQPKSMRLIRSSCVSMLGQLKVKGSAWTKEGWDRGEGKQQEPVCRNQQSCVAPVC